MTGEGTMAGINRITEERARQVAKGYDLAHDQGHPHGALAHAAAAYLLADPAWWPFTGQPPAGACGGGDSLDRLVKAGALIAAEIDRRLAGS